jgi:rRNA maturation protein Nop10
MPYCWKCGNKVEETMAFCPNCGTALKVATPSQPAPVQPCQRSEKAEKNEKQEKRENLEKSGKQEKAEYNFIGSLIGGLILIIIGVFAIIDLTHPFLISGQDFAVMLLMIGVIIIIGAVYAANTAWKRFLTTPLG